MTRIENRPSPSIKPTETANKTDKAAEADKKTETTAAKPAETAAKANAGVQAAETTVDTAGAKRTDERATTAPTSKPTVSSRDKLRASFQSKVAETPGAPAKLNESGSPARLNETAPLPPPPGQVDQGKVDRAVDSIKSSLSTGWTDWDVTKGDLNNIKNTVQNLNPAEARAAFARLSDSELRTWSNELNGAINGYSRDEKQGLYNTLASKLDSTQLNRMMGAMSDKGDVGLLGKAIGQNAPADVKRDFITAAAGRLNSDPSSGLAIANTIAGMRNNPAELQQALSGLNQGQIQKVVDEAKQHRMDSSGGLMGGSPHLVITYDAKPLGDMLNAVGGISDPRIKADVFSAGANALKDIDSASGVFGGSTVMKGNSVADVRNGLTSLMNSDVNGVVNQLETRDRNGQGLATYMKTMFDAGQKDVVGNQMAQLLTGNGKNESSMDRFSATIPGADGRPHYKNAQNLGYFMGGIQAGIKQITDGVDKQAGLVKDVFSAALGAVGAANTGAGVGASLLNGLTGQVINQVADSIKGGYTDLRDGLRQLAFPRDGAGNPYEGAAETAYDSASSRVILANQ